MRRSLIAIVVVLLSGIVATPLAHAQESTVEEASDQPILSRGDRGSSVAAWQSALNDWLEAGPVDADPLLEDGIFGPRTEAATRLFQETQGVPADGVVGPVTRAAFLSAPALAAEEPDPAAETPFIAIGDLGPEVTDWQEMLNEWLEVNRMDMASLAEDGFFGPRTANATRTFQAAQSITVDGVVGPETRAAYVSAPTLVAERPSTDLPLLERGDTGAGVAAWQESLNDWLQIERTEAGRLSVDGVFGRKTEAATLDFQRALGIADDGVVGPQTRAALELAVEDR